MTTNVRCACSSSRLLTLALFFVMIPPALAEPITLKHAVELALMHSSTAAIAQADQEKARQAYLELRNQYIPVLVVGSGLAKSWGFPLSLEGSAPTLVNVTSQSVLYNPAQREFLRAARLEVNASNYQNKDQRNQVILDTVLAYIELRKWESSLGALSEQESEAGKTEAAVQERVNAGVDSPLEFTKARLVVARVRVRMAQAQGAADVLRTRLSQLTGIAAASIQTVPDSVPPFPELNQQEDFSGKSVQASPAVRSAEEHALAEQRRAMGEHKALYPSADFVAQYGLFSTYNNFEQFYKRFQRNNAVIGISLRLPFFNMAQRARARQADADALHAKKAAEQAREKISTEALQLQRSVQQLEAARDVAELEYQIAQAGFEAAQTRLDTGTGTLHDLDDARTQANERFNTFQDASFELERARLNLLRATGELETWAMGQ